MNDIKVGDVVAWADVPDGALARRNVDDGGFFYLRRGEEGWCVGKMQDESEHYFEAPPADLWPWRYRAYEAAPVTIVSLGISGQESADDLRRLAEVFEVREALRADDQLSLLMEADGVVRIDHIEDEQTQAERLHAAGWRPGMTAEDAARLLAQTGP